MRTLLMMRTKGLVQPFFQNGNKAATVKSPTAVKSNGNFIRFKELNP